MMARFVKKHLVALTIFIALLIIGCLVLTSSETDFTSLVIEKADYPIMSPVVRPQDPNNSVYLLVIISSAPGGVNVERRKAIRSTWGSKPDPNSERSWHVIFMTGKTNDNNTDKSLFKESRIYGDLFICDYKDQYSRILDKLLAAFNWASNVQSKYHFQYVLKTDDDVYVNIPRLYQWIDTVGSQQQHLYAGVLYTGTVVRSKTHRHYVSEDQIPFNYYPVFCKGSMQVISSSLFPKIVYLSRKIQRIIPDDAYVGLIMNELKIKPVKIQGLVQQSLMPWILMITEMCVFKNVIGLGDSLTPQQIHHMHSVATLEHKSLWTCVLWSRMSLVTIIILLIIYYHGQKIQLWLRRRWILLLRR